MAGGTLYQGLLVHADGRFVADVEMAAGVVRALRMARSDAAGAAGWRDLTGKLVFPGPVVLCRSDAARAWQGGMPATTVAVPVASLGPPAGEPPPVDAVPVPLLRGVAAELEVLPDAVFGRGCVAFAVHDRVLREAAFDGDLVRSRALHDATCTSGHSPASVKPTRISSCVVVALFIEKHAREVNGTGTGRWCGTSPCEGASDHRNRKLVANMDGLLPVRYLKEV